MPTDWMQILREETTIGLAELRDILNAICNLDDAIDVTLDSHERFALGGEIKGLMRALRFQGAEPNTVVAAIKQARKEREA